MKHNFITAGILLALSATASAAGPRMERFIERVDTDGDGQVSRAEFVAHQPPRGDIMEHADMDGDGMVTLDELRQRHQERMAERMAEQQKRRQANETRLEEMFASLDTNGDGSVTADEARGAAFTEMDADGDGYLSADEFRPPRQARGKHGKDHRRPHRGFPE
jgi:Ca2+-binding EF-hand superfamily protein